MLSIQEISEVPTRKVLTEKSMWHPELLVAICNVIGNTKTESTEEHDKQTLLFLSMSGKPELRVVVERGFVPVLVVEADPFRMEKERWALKGICAEFNLRYEEENDDNL
jgi:hypothetical protein